MENKVPKLWKIKCRQLWKIVYRLQKTMKGKRVWLLLAVMVLSSYLNLSVYADKVSDPICNNDTIKGIRYDESVGYYLEKEIPHGLEFEIIEKKQIKLN